MSSPSKVRALCFHLPQFHPIAENDKWWGKGFTEWTNGTRTAPRFEGHYQPHLPADLGFYDLRLPEARQAQADLAREYGIHGFCFYHYWFNGRRVLERPVNEIVASGQPDFPFCLCWANENWTRRWDGAEKELLLEQIYSAEDDVAHIRSLIPTFKDRRYIKVGGRPLFLVYRALHLPDPTGTINRWRAELQAAGFPGIYLCNVESFATDHGLAAKLPFDAAVEFAPDHAHLPPFAGRDSVRKPPFFKRSLPGPPWSNNNICEYAGVRDSILAKRSPSYLRYRCATPMWDNSARRKEMAFIVRNSTPELYEQWLRRIVETFVPPSPDENFVFINAWNEWAEGSHLEPCQKWGRQYLEATRRALG